MTALRLIQFLAHWEGHHAEGEFCPEIRPPGECRRKGGTGTPINILLQWAPPIYQTSHWHPLHPSIQMVQCSKGKQKLLQRQHKPHRFHAQPGKHGFVFLLSSFCAQNMQEIVLCCCSWDSHYTRTAKPTAKCFIPHRSRGCGHHPQPNLHLQPLRVLFEYSEPLNHCF